MITLENVDHLFQSVVELGKKETEQAHRLTVSAQEFAEAILKSTPVCADQQAAIRKVREALWTANAAIFLQETW